MTYDVIVGAGSVGCVLAARLREDPTCEVLLEAEADYPAREQLPLDIADGSGLPDHSGSHDWGLVGVPGSRGVPPVPLPRGWIVGGSSAVNGTFALRGFPEDYEAWEAASNAGWGFDEVLEVFRRLDTDFDFADRPWHADAGPVPVHRYGLAERSVVADVFLEAACIDPDPTGGGHPHQLVAALLGGRAPLHDGRCVCQLHHGRGRRPRPGDLRRQLPAPRCGQSHLRPSEAVRVNQNIRTA